MNNANPIRTLIDEIIKYEAETPKPDNQLGYPAYLAPLLERYTKIKEIANEHITSYQEDIDLFSGVGGSRRRSKRKNRTSKRKSRK